MDVPEIDFDEVQKAMEDTDRDAFEYFLDILTGDVIILSEDIIRRAWQILEKGYDEDMAEFDEVEFDELPDIPDWMEEEIELALEVLVEGRQRYARIPERDPAQGYAVMRDFASELPECGLKEDIFRVLDGKGSFRRFKDLLDPYPKEKKRWYGFNAKATRKEIEEWLMSLGIAFRRKRGE